MRADNSPAGPSKGCSSCSKPTSAVPLTTYTVPNDTVHPFEPSRTLEAADATTWHRYAARPTSRRSVFGLPVLSPVSRWVAAWDGCMAVVDLTYTAFLVAVSLAFSTTHAIDWLVGFDFAGTAFYAADVLAQLHVGYVLKGWDEQRQVVCDGSHVARYYLRHGTACWDMPAVLAIIPQAVLLGRGGGPTAWKIWYLLRMLRLLRTVRLVKAVWGAALSLHDHFEVWMFYLTTASIYALSVLWVLFVIVNTIGCFLWWLAEVEGLEDSWVSGPYITQPQLHDGLLSDQADIVKWLYSVYFALSGVTTAVYGDAIPTTPAEIVVSMCMDFASVFWWGAVVTLIFQVMQVVSRKARKASALLDKMSGVEGFMQERLLPPDLQQKVRRYLARVWGPLQAGEDADVLSLLPAALHGEVVWRAAGSLLSNARLLRCLSTEALHFLASQAALHKLPAGHDLFCAGKPSSDIYLVQCGELAIQRGWKQLAAISGPALVGQVALLPALWQARGNANTGAVGEQWMHTVRAVNNCVLWRLSAEDIAMAVEDEPAAAGALCQAYAQYLDELPRAAGAGSLPPKAAAIRREVAQLLSEEVQPAQHAAVPAGQPSEGDARAQTQQREATAWMVAAAATFMQERLDEAGDGAGPAARQGGLAESEVHTWDSARGAAHGSASEDGEV